MSKKKCGDFVFFMKIIYIEDSSKLKQCYNDYCQNISFCPAFMTAVNFV